MIDVYLVYNDDKQLERFKEVSFDTSFFFHSIDDRTRQGRKDAWKVKGAFSARQSPFAIIYENDKPIKAFYTEADTDIINSLIQYLNENLCSNNK